MELSDQQIPYELQRLIDSELAPNERALWKGQPIPSRFARIAWGIVLFGIPWTAFSIFWVAGAATGISHSGAPGLFALFPLFGVPFILIGLGMLSSPYWMQRKAKRTVYVVTNQRAIVFSSGWQGSMTIRSFQGQQLSDIRRKQNTDGSGDLVFAQDWRTDGEGSRVATNVGFMAIRDVKSVEQLVRSLIV